MKRWILILIMGVLKAQMPGSEMDARFLTDEEREERQENPPDGLGKATIFCLPTYGTHIIWAIYFGTMIHRL